MRVDGLELTRLGRELLHTTAKSAEPDVAPLILGYRPYIIIKQLAVGIGHGIVLDLTIGDVNQSAVICTEPHRAILSAMAGHHNIRGYVEANLVEDLGLARRAYIFYYTTVIGTEPVVAGSIDSGGVDIAQLEGVEAHEFLDVLVQAVTIAGYPHVTALIEHELLLRVLADRRGVELIVDKLLYLGVLGVDDIDAVVVGSQPYPASLVHADIPCLKVGCQRSDAEGGEIIVE